MNAERAKSAAVGAARSWLQWHTINGDSVTWGSSDELRPPLTVLQVETLAKHVAEAVLVDIEKGTP